MTAQHPVVGSKPCHICKANATERYDCVDCKKPCCGKHLEWCQLTDKKYRCTKCYKTHIKTKV